MNKLFFVVASFTVPAWAITALASGIEMEPVTLFCARDQGVYTADGSPKMMFRDPYEHERRPTAMTFPKTGEKGLLAESLSEDGRYYMFTMAVEHSPHPDLIQGVFDRTDKTLTVARANLFKDDRGDINALAGSLVFLCETVQ